MTFSCVSILAGDRVSQVLVTTQILLTSKLHGQYLPEFLVHGRSKSVR
jgi:hypothetical protein